MSTPAATPPAAPAYAPPAPRRALVVPPNGGTAFTAFGDRIVFKLGSAETGGALTLSLGEVPPGGGPPPHRHEAEDEVFIVVSGRTEFWVDGAWTAAEPGAVVYLPRGVAHTFRNAGETVSRHWVITTPGGFDRFFAECSQVFADAAEAGAAPDMGRVLDVFARHQIALLG
jgi:quercetin dioxygenase-like cupin family protein